MLCENSENLSISNSSIAFFGKKSDLESYSLLCKEYETDRIADNETLLSYQLYLNFQNEEAETLFELLENFMGNNITVSEGVVITL